MVPHNGVLSEMDTTNVEMTYVNILFWIGGISIRQNCLRPCLDGLFTFLDQ
jgi:hypothetical protein